VTPAFGISSQRLQELKLQRTELIRQRKSTDRRTERIAGRARIQPAVEREPIIKVEDEDKGSHMPSFLTEENEMTPRKRRPSPVGHMDVDGMRARKRPMVVIPRKSSAHRKQFRELEECEDHANGLALGATHDPVRALISGSPNSLTVPKGRFSDVTLINSGYIDDGRHALCNQRIAPDQPPTLTDAVTPGANINVIKHIGGPDILSSFDRAYPRLGEWAAEHRRRIAGAEITSSFDGACSGLDEIVANQTLHERTCSARSANKPTPRYTWLDTSDEEDDPGSLCDFVVDDEAVEEEEEDRDGNDEDYIDDLYCE
jgi:hypothetical protein